MKKKIFLNQSNRDLFIKFTFKAQTTLEITTLIVIVAAGIWLMSVYMKRAIQGRIRSQWEVMSERYSPTKTVSYINKYVNMTTQEGVAVNVLEDKDIGEINISNNAQSNYKISDSFQKTINTTQKVYQVEGFSENEPLF